MALLAFSSIKSNRASILFIVVVFILIISSSLQDYQAALWQQKKLLNLEKARDNTAEYSQNFISKSLSHITSYAQLNKIPNNIVVKDHDFTLKYSLLASRSCGSCLDNSAGFKCNKYKIFKIEMHSKFDFKNSNKYHENMTYLCLYAIVCETIDLNYNREQQAQIKVFPLSIIHSNHHILNYK